MVNKRSNAGSGGPSGGESTSVEGTSTGTNTDAVFQELLSTVSQLQMQVTSYNDSISQKYDSIFSEISSMKATIDSLSKDTSIIRKNLTRKEADGTTPLSEINSEGTKSEDDLKLQTNRKIELLVKKVIEGVKKEIDSLAKEIRDEDSKKSQEQVHCDCIEEMMRKTEILDRDDGKVSRVRTFYEKIYSTSPLTSCLLTFLKLQSQVKIVIDFKSSYIENMKAIVTDHDGVEKNGNALHNFADFEKQTIYLGAKVDEKNKEEFVISDLAFSCSQLAIYLAFMNRGWPYAEDDEVNKIKFTSILDEALERQKNGDKGEVFNWYDGWIQANKMGKGIYLIAAVPGIVQEFGSTDGTSKLRTQLPSLLSYYEDQVMKTLLQKSSEATGEVVGLKKPDSEIPQEVPPIVEDQVQFDCIEEMMRKTEILDRDDGKVSRVRSLYGKVYNTSPLTSCLLKFLKLQPRVKIVVDCDSYYIEKMKAIFTDHDGVERNGNKFHLYADFEEQTIYLGVKADEKNKEEYVVGDVAFSFSHLAIYLAFMNRGWPYAEDDEVNKIKFKEILEEALEKKRNGVKGEIFNWFDGLNKATELGKGIYLIASVPGIVAEFGSTEGTSKLRKQMPSLFSYYEEHVMKTLLNKANN